MPNWWQPNHQPGNSYSGFQGYHHDLGPPMVMIISQSWHGKGPQTFAAWSWSSLLNGNSVGYISTFGRSQVSCLLIIQKDTENHCSNHRGNHFHPAWWISDGIIMGLKRGSHQMVHMASCSIELAGLAGEETDFRGYHAPVQTHPHKPVVFFFRFSIHIQKPFQICTSQY